MRCLVYRDIKIKEAEYRELLATYTKFIKDNTGIDVIFWTLDKDYTDYPTVLDTDGDDVMRQDFIQSLCKDITAKYGDYGVDNVITLIHEDNWKSGKTATRRGIWGQNFSYKYGNYHVQYCRFDKKLVNSFGTLNHEIDHTFDALIKVEIGVDVNPILGVVNYDKNSTHGEPKAIHAYIRNRENADKLKVLAPYLASAYKKRLERHVDAIKGKQMTIIGLLEQLVYLYRQKLNKKDGNKK